MVVLNIAVSGKQRGQSGIPFIFFIIIYLLLVECRESSINQWRKDIVVMRVKQCHKPSMTGNGNHTTYKHCDDWWMVKMACVYPH